VGAAPCLNVGLRSRRKAWLAATAGLLVLGFLGYIVTVIRYCGEFQDVTRGSALFRLCSMSSEPIASVPVVDPIRGPRYSRRLADGLKPSLHFVRYDSARAAPEVRATLEAYFTSRGFTLARRETEHDWWTDHQSEMGLATRATGERTCEVEVIQNSGFE